MANITQILDELGAIKEEANSAYGHYKNLKSAEDELKLQLEVALRESGLKSAKNDHYNVSMASKPNIMVTDETSVIKWLESNPDIESDRYVGLKKAMFDPLAKTILKSTGEVIPGTEIQTTEYLSIAKVKSAKTVE